MEGHSSINPLKGDKAGGNDVLSPLVLSASRRTDIPAFFARQFLDQLKRSAFLLRDPFNKKARIISTERLRGIIFWTKNPAPLIPLLPELKPFIYYFQYTLNDYEKEGFEPNIPPLKERIATFKALSRLIGRERVIWRFDPLILTDRITPERLLGKIKRIGDQIHPYTEKLIFSFADIDVYPKVRKRMSRAGINCLEFTPGTMAELAKEIAQLNRGWGLLLATCAEGIDLDAYGIEHNRCIDGHLLNRLATQGEEPPVAGPPGGKIKDKGQRASCGCLPSTDVGQYNTCRHLCLYCYARR